MVCGTYFTPSEWFHWNDDACLQVPQGGAVYPGQVPWRDFAPTEWSLFNDTACLQVPQGGAVYPGQIPWRDFAPAEWSPWRCSSLQVSRGDLNRWSATVIVDVFLLGEGGVHITVEFGLNSTMSNEDPSMPKTASEKGIKAWSWEHIKYIHNFSG